MEEFKGTPGPWSGKDVRICRQDEASLQLGFIMTSDEKRRDEYAANAHLIAAAPELLEALQDFMSSSSGNTQSCGHDFECICRFEKAKRAIAKALGK